LTPVPIDRSRQRARRSRSRARRNSLDNANQVRRVSSSWRSVFCQTSEVGEWANERHRL